MGFALRSNKQQKQKHMTSYQKLKQENERLNDVIVFLQRQIKQLVLNPESELSSLIKVAVKLNESVEMQYFETRGALQDELKFKGILNYMEEKNNENKSA